MYSWPMLIKWSLWGSETAWFILIGVRMRIQAVLTKPKDEQIDFGNPSQSTSISIGMWECFVLGLNLYHVALLFWVVRGEGCCLWWSSSIRWFQVPVLIMFCFLGPASNAPSTLSVNSLVIHFSKTNKNKYYSKKNTYILQPFSLKLQIASKMIFYSITVTTEPIGVEWFAILSVELEIWIFDFEVLLEVPMLHKKDWLFNGNFIFHSKNIQIFLVRTFPIWALEFQTIQRRHELRWLEWGTMSFQIKRSRMVYELRSHWAGRASQ